MRIEIGAATTMGNQFTKLFGRFKVDKRILMVGLDAAGESLLWVVQQSGLFSKTPDRQDHDSVQAQARPSAHNNSNDWVSKCER